MNSDVFAKIGNKSPDFYFKCGNDGRKRYYSRITGRLVAKNQINPSIINEVKELIEDTNSAKLAKLYSKKIKLQKDIERSQCLLQEIDKQIEHDQRLKGNIKENISQSDYENAIQNEIHNYESMKEEQDRKDEIRRKEYEEECRKNTGNYETRSKQNQKDSKKSPLTPNKDNILKDLGITTKKQLNSWLLHNHPDKGGDTDLCSRVILAGKANNWSQ